MLKFAYDNSPNDLLGMIFFQKLPQPQEYAKKAMVKKHDTSLKKRMSSKFQLQKLSRAFRNTDLAMGQPAALLGTLQ